MTKTVPLVSAALHVGQSHHPWQAAPIERLVVCGHTPSGVRLLPGSLSGVQARPGQTLLNRPDHLLYCLPDAATWASAQHHHASW